MKRKGITAVELMAKLNADPDFVAKRAQREAEFQAREAELGRAEAPVVADLETVGVRVRSVWDLVNTAEPYPEAYPVLLRHLERPYLPVIREGIARSLAVRDAAFAWPTLTRLYRAETEERAKDGLAVAIATISNDNLVGDVIELARDKSCGPSRVLLLRALERSRDPRAHATLRELASDPDLVKEIRVIERRLERKLARKKQ